MTNKRILGWVIIAGLLVLLLAGLFAVGFYLDNGKAGVFKSIAKYLPLPVALVGNQPVWYADFLVLSNAATKAGGDLDLSSDFRNEVLQKLVEDRVVADLAKKTDVEISDGDVNDYYRALLKKLKIEDPGREIPARLGMTEQGFRNLIVRPDLLEQALASSYLRTNEAASSAFQKAENAKRRLDKGEDFAVLAGELSDDDETKYIGGDLGLLPKWQIPLAFRDTAVGLEPGAISDPIAGPEGFHLIQVTAREEEGEEPLWQLRQIFFRDESFIPYLDQKIQSYRVRILIKK